MANYVLTFRAPKGSALTAEDEARWPAWLAGIGVISATSLDAAAAVAERCPMLLQGGSVEVGEVLPAGSAS